MSHIQRSPRSPLILIGVAAALLVATPAAAERIVLSGSDGTTFHGNSAFATDLRDYLQGSSSLPVLLLGDDPATAAFTASVSGVGVATTSSLGSVTLSADRYSGLVVLSASNNGTGCCDSDDARVAGFQSDITAFLASGGSLAIQNYIGEATYDPILGTAGGASARVYGFLGGRGGTSGYDDESVTAAGIAAGFQNYPTLETWGHQGYDMRYFGPRGFVSLIDAPVYGRGVSALLSTDALVPVPEPSTLLLFATGVAGLARLRMRSHAKRTCTGSRVPR